MIALEVPALWDGAAFQALLHQETVPPPLLSRAWAALGNAAGVSVSAAGLWEFMALQFGVFLLAVCHLVRPLAAPHTGCHGPCGVSRWQCAVWRSCQQQLHVAWHDCVLPFPSFWQLDSW